MVSPLTDPNQAERDRYWLQMAIDLSRRCPHSSTAFSVGAVIVSSDGNVIADGYSREGGPHMHAEERALGKVQPGDPRLGAATIYSSLEPCSQRRSGPRTCVQLIVAAGIRRVVFALREPSTFVDGKGAEELRDAGVTVVEFPQLAGDVAAVNSHLLRKPSDAGP